MINAESETNLAMQPLTSRSEGSLVSCTDRAATEATHHVADLCSLRFSDVGHGHAGVAVQRLRRQHAHRRGLPQLHE